jgi:hypothetical protein
MCSTGEPEGREHVGDEYVTYDRRKERTLRPDFPPFPPSSDEEEEVHREAKRRAKHEPEHETKRMMGGAYERQEVSGKTPMDSNVTFMRVINNLVVSQQAMTQSLDDRLAIVGTLGTQAPHAAPGN